MTATAYATLSGGTRTAVKTHRPWQVRPVLPPKEQCPLCSKPQLDEYHPTPGWRTFANSNTPFSFHRLLAPTKCWEIAKLWELGGQGTLTSTLRLVLNEMNRTGIRGNPAWIFTHVGYGAGQNLSHHHWHILRPPDTPSFPSTGDHVPLWETQTLRIILCGIRAGQILVLPKDAEDVERLLPDLAAAVWRIITAFNEKFDRPDYCVFLGIHGPRQWFLRYTPILNNWGGTEFAALDCGTPFVLPWAHQATEAFLTSSGAATPSSL